MSEPFMEISQICCTISSDHCLAFTVLDMSAVLIKKNLNPIIT